MRIFEFASSIKRDNQLLFWGGVFHLALFALAGMMYFSDHTVVTGVNAWIKPMKFGLSVWIYLWTFGWLLKFIPSQRKKTLISWGILFCMLIENAAIFYQASRGQTSHYNISSAGNAVIFSMMGSFIAVNSVINLYVLVLFFTEKIDLDASSLFAWRAGLAFFVLGGIAGGLMVSMMSHTVGASDGGPGLPFLNWSTRAGDLRVAHFITLHGLQAIPMVNTIALKSAASSWRITQAFTLFYLVLIILLHVQALAGQPLFSEW